MTVRNVIIEPPKYNETTEDCMIEFTIMDTDLGKLHYKGNMGSKFFKDWNYTEAERDQVIENYITQRINDFHAECHAKAAAEAEAEGHVVTEVGTRSTSPSLPTLPVNRSRPGRA